MHDDPTTIQIQVLEHLKAELARAVRDADYRSAADLKDRIDFIEAHLAE